MVLRFNFLGELPAPIDIWGARPTLVVKPILEIKVPAEVRAKTPFKIQRCSLTGSISLLPVIVPVKVVQELRKIVA